MKKIVVSAYTRFGVGDGMNRFFSSVFPYLLEKYEIYLFMRGGSNPPAHAITHPNLKVFDLPFYGLGVKDGKGLRRYHESVQRLHEGDLYFVQDSMCFQPIFVSRRRKKPLVHYFHAFEWDIVKGKIPKFRAAAYPAVKFLKTLALYWYKRCHHIFVPSRRMLKNLSGRGFDMPISVLPLGIDLEKFYPTQNGARAKQSIGLPSGSFVMGYTGRIQHEKNVPMLLETFKSLSGRYPDLYLLCVGGGVPSIVEKLSEHPRIKVVAPQTDILTHLHAMDVFCMPSATETSSLSTMEAMAAGLPVIASDVGCISEYISHGENGMLFDSGDWDAMKSHCVSFIESKDKRDRIGEAAHATMARRNDWKVVAEGISLIFDNLLDVHESPAEEVEEHYDEALIERFMRNAFELTGMTALSRQRIDRSEYVVE